MYIRKQNIERANSRFLGIRCILRGAGFGKTTNRGGGGLVQGNADWTIQRQDFKFIYKGLSVGNFTTLWVWGCLWNDWGLMLE